MARTQPLSLFLYSSLLSPDAAPTCVADIVRTARHVNAELQVTGVLVFDGQRFCQYLEGPPAPIQALAERIAQDTRHTAFEPQHHGPLIGPRRFRQWFMAYALATDTEPLERLHGLRGPAALDLFEELLPQFDMGPPVPA